MIQIIEDIHRGIIHREKFHPILKTKNEKFMLYEQTKDTTVINWNS